MFDDERSPDDVLARAALARFHVGWPAGPQSIVDITHCTHCGIVAAMTVRNLRVCISCIEDTRVSRLNRAMCDLLHRGVDPAKNGGQTT